MGQLFFSIVTAAFNAANNLPNLLDSLARQTCRDFELVVQEGASTDDTVAMLNAWRDRLPALSLASEPDSGIYDAWNRALERIQGQWVLFLGADDALYAPDVLERVKAILEEQGTDAAQNILFAGGDVLIQKEDSGSGRVWRYDSASPKGRAAWRGMPFPYPGLFHHRSLFAFNRFDATLHIAADYDFVCRFWTPDNGALVLPLTVTTMREGGISSRPDELFRLRWENTLVFARYFRPVWTPYRLLLLAEAGGTWLLYRVFGQSALVIPDFFRKICGLPPAWH